MTTKQKTKKDKKENNLLPRLFNIDLGFEPSEQQIAIRKFVRGSAGNSSINAVAGSGKTSTLAVLAQYMKPPNTLFLAFNTHIVSELERKLPHFSGASKQGAFGIRTNNSFAYRVIRENMDGRNIKVDQWKLSYISEEVITPFFSAFPRYKLRAIGNILASAVGMCMNTCTDFKNEAEVRKMIDDYGVYLGNYEEELIPLISTVIEKALQIFYSSGSISFTEQVWLPVYLKMRPRQFPEFIFGDEQQDLNVAQIEMMRLAIGPNTRYVGVGDPYQAIYAFTGARADAYQFLVNSFECKEFPLSVCYRCPHSHLELARQIVPHIQDRDNCPDGIVEYLPYDKLLRDGVHVESGDLIISRLTAPLIIQCIRLIKNKQQARVRGRDIGKSLVRFCDDAMDVETDISKLSSAIEGYVERQKIKLSGRRDADEKFQVLDDNKEAIKTMIESFNSPNYEAFKKDIEGIFSDEHSAIWLSTIHKAKGLEAKNVVMFDSAVNKTKMPFVHPKQSSVQKEQEMNIKYVALTRAKQKLTIIQ